VWKSRLFFALLFLSIFSLSINAASSESKEVQKPSDFDIWSSIQSILERYGALGIIATVALFWYQQWSERIDRIQRSCNAILRELEEIRNSLQEEEKRIRNYYFEKSLLSENVEIRKIDYRNTYMITDSYDSILHSGLFTHLSENMQYKLSNVYDRIKTHNNRVTSINQFEERTFKMLELELYLTDLETDIISLIYDTLEEVKAEKYDLKPRISYSRIRYTLKLRGNLDDIPEYGGAQIDDD